MQSHVVGFFLAICVASCAANCHKDDAAEKPDTYLCEGITDLTDLNIIPATAQRITILNSRIPTIQRDAFVRFAASLISLNITNAAVSDIQAGAFARLAELRELIVNHNEIKTVKTNWIQDLPKVEILHLWYNNINEIEPAVFELLPHLVLLDIAHNSLNNCIPPALLAHLKNLEVLYVSDNPWPLKCRPDLIFKLEHAHVRLIHTWGYTHILIEECLAHEPATRHNETALKNCVNKLSTNPHLFHKN